MVNSYDVFGPITKIEVPHKKTGEVFVFTIDTEDLPLVESKNSWGMDKNKTSAVANFRKDGKMCKITMHKLIAGYKNTNFADNNRFNLRKKNLVESDYRKRIRACGTNIKGNRHKDFGSHIGLFTGAGTDEGVVLLDKKDWERASHYTWNVNRKTGYAQTKTHGGRKNSKPLYLHRLILGKECEGMYVDHISGNRLDNRRKNLRVCTNSENLHNNPHANSSNRSTGIRGVSLLKSGHNKGRYLAQIKVNKIHHRILFKTLDEAVAQRRAWEVEYLRPIESDFN
jgi:hypothetical protein